MLACELSYPLLYRPAPLLSGAVTRRLYIWDKQAELHMILASLVERLFRMPRITGSIPGGDSARSREGDAFAGGGAEFGIT